MNAKTKLLRDAGLLTLAATIALGAAGAAAGAKRPCPHNFIHPHQAV